MSVFKENWQSTKSTIKERNTFMFNNDLLSDVKFVVRGSSNNQSEGKKVIPAHKYVLSISSPVFLAMFYGEMPETADPIDLPDCEYEGLLELFRYMYSDEVKLSGSNVMQVLYMAKKYMVPLLADKCTEYLQTNLDASNAFCVLRHAQKYEAKHLVNRCWELIDAYTEEAVKSDGFAEIEASLLQAVVERDSLDITEVELFKAVDSWATQECERQGLETDGPVKRTVLGERIVKGIRFPLMKETECASVVFDSKILTQKEVSYLLKYYNYILASSVGFSEIPRFEPIVKRCCRFDSLASKAFKWNCGTGEQDFLIMSVSENIKLHGLCMCGSATDNEYSVTLAIKEVTSGSVVVSKSGRFPSVIMKYKSSEFYGFHVLFDSPVSIRQGIKYCIMGKLSGPLAYYGVNGFNCVHSSGVTFHFENSSEGTIHRTRVAEGLFHEFLFTARKH